MKRIIKYLLLSITILTANCLEKDDGEIKKIEIASINWSIVSKSPIPIIAFWNDKHPGVEFNYKLIEDDKKLFDYLLQKVSSFKEKGEKSDRIDTRISIRISYKNSNNIDTLSFGRTNVMKFNKYSCPIDLELLKTISKYLSDTERQIIETEL
jgi:hypothetical protein